MELDIRLIVTLAGMALSVASSFVVVRTKLQQVEKDIDETFKRMAGLDTRLDSSDKTTEVTTQRLNIITSMMAPDTLERRHRETERMKATLDIVVSDVLMLKKMHNGSHPVIKDER